MSGTATRQRQQFVKLRCTPDEAARFAAVADRQGKTVSGLVRDTLLGAEAVSRKPRGRQPKGDAVELARISGLLGKYGSNVNQLAHVANMDGHRLAEAQLYQIAAEVREVKLLVLKVLGYGD